MKIKIAKYELYPADDPIGYAIGFNVTTSNGRNLYRDVVISLDDISNGDTEVEIVNKAWTNLSEGIMNEVTLLENKSQALGGIFSPDGQTITNDHGGGYDVQPGTSIKEQLDNLGEKVDNLTEAIDTLLTGQGGGES